ncbi:hypothetical protein, partial [Pedobacter hartonius]
MIEKYNSLIFYTLLIVGASIVVFSAYYTYSQTRDETHSKQLFLLTLMSCLIGSIGTILGHIDSDKNEALAKASALEAKENAQEAKRNYALYSAQLHENLDTAKSTLRTSHIIIDTLNKNLELTTGVLKNNIEAKDLLTAQMKSTGEIFRRTTVTIANSSKALEYSSKTLSEMERQNTPLRDIGLSFTIIYPMGKNYKSLDSLVAVYKNELTSSSYVYRYASRKTSVNGRNSQEKTRKTSTLHKGDFEVIRDTLFGTVNNEIIKLNYNSFDKKDGLYRYVFKVPRFYVYNGDTGPAKTDDSGPVITIISGPLFNTIIR